MPECPLVALEHLHGAVSGDLFVGFLQRGNGFVEALEIAQGAAVLEQSSAKVVSVKAGGKGLFVGQGGVGVGAGVRRALVSMGWRIPLCHTVQRSSFGTRGPARLP